jgi:hypothetical protein
MPNDVIKQIYYIIKTLAFVALPNLLYLHSSFFLLTLNLNEGVQKIF